ncbi:MULTISPECIES: TylF/MycF/NovP-related O-methyltransferase [Pseudanabaena]|uniref:Macrocin-O-methyltransferase n=2 Tax=Pseudanabaena TaxID=1152 RepID=L8N3Q4_9CYAN|nr:MULTISPECIES: TylF/MycF/NovP-related O-methyltransferase [Pseudanabaena]ELS33340.1 macrocin-O-methyltransferase [Pseudanabaena biceps PCC 7429]MDG3494437.1 TylF/MycF/NovP-related O-methyltransferase [Pseudanabaena catenata USMAC16]
MKQLLKSTLRRFGYDLVPYVPVSKTTSALASVPDLSEAQQRIILAAKPFTMTSVERMATLINAVTYLSQNGIAGDIAECGVWRGGSMMTVALTLMALGDLSRSLYLFDTFEGMSSPTDDDRSLDGVSADLQLDRDPQGSGIWCYASLDEVRANILSTGYPEQKIHLLKGKVEDTIPRNMPSQLSLLRLDTDWYESTKHELIHLYPILTEKGILIIDDYGHWQGAKKAVDDYFAELDSNIYLHRIDYTGRILVKPSR